MAISNIRARRRAAAALSAALLMATLTTALTGAARQPASPARRPAQPGPARPALPVQAAFSPSGPYATTTGTATDGTAVYDLYRPAATPRSASRARS